MEAFRYREREMGPMGGAMGAAAIAEALEELRFHWGEAYEIEFSDEHGWRARRLDGLGDWLTAPDPDGLEKAIFGDYTANPVPRTEGPPS